MIQLRSVQVSDTHGQIDPTRTLHDRRMMLVKTLGFAALAVFGSELAIPSNPRSQSAEIPIIIRTPGFPSNLLLICICKAFFPTALAQDDSSDDTRSVQSTFVTPSKALSFAFSIPEDDNDDFYFTLRVHRSFSWGAVGLGSDDMPGALFFMVYDNRNGESVTFSPRLAYGHYEPKYFPELEFEELGGTGIFDKHMVFQGRCTKHCRRWPKHDTEGGSIDINSTNQTAVWALGMREGFASNDPAEGIKYHEQFGSFTINMARTQGAKTPPHLDGSAVSEGTDLLSEHGSLADIHSTLHAVFMIIAIVGLMPLGVVILRLGGAARWHGLNQAAAMVFVFVGFGLGIVTSFRYQRVCHIFSPYDERKY